MGDFLNEVIENLENGTRMKAMMNDYGEKHGNLCQRYSLTGEVWEAFGVALLQSISTRDGVKEFKANTPIVKSNHPLRKR